MRRKKNKVKRIDFSTLRNKAYDVKKLIGFIANLFYVPTNRGLLLQKWQ
jgi:hypothetical protein